VVENDLHLWPLTWHTYEAHQETWWGKPPESNEWLRRCQ